MFNGWKDALSSYGWLIPTVLVLVLAVFMGMQYSKSTRVIPTAALPGNTTKVIPREAGVNFDVATFCNMPDTTVVGASLKNYAPDSQWTYKYVLKNANESIEWLTASNNGPNQNISADHFIIPANGIQQGLPQVELTKDAAKCIWAKGGLPKE